MPDHEVWLTDDGGVRLAYLGDVLSGYWYQIANARGPFSMRLAPSFDTQILLSGSKLIPDRMVQFWRAPDGGSLSLWRPYFVQYLDVGRSQAGKLEIEIKGYDPNELLRRRIAAAFAGSSSVSKAGIEADDMMKDVAADMLSDVIPPVPDEGTRAWPSLSVQADATEGPQIDKSFAWREALAVLQDLGMEARQAGTEVFFDIVVSNVTSSSISFEFRTSIGQPVGGTDLTSLGGVFDEARGNLQTPRTVYDNREAVNYVYSGGQGEGTDRNVQQVADSTRYGQSQWNRRERFMDARNQVTSTGVADAGNRMLADGEPVVRFTAVPKDTTAFAFGVNWFHGDKVTAVFLKQGYTTILRKTGIRLTPDRREQIDSIMEFQE